MWARSRRYASRLLQSLLGRGRDESGRKSPGYLPPVPPRLEQVLSCPLRDVLPHIQERIVSRSRYFGVKAMVNPLDLWICQEIIFERRPDVIVEIGCHSGGSALAMAHLLDALGHGRILSVDIDMSQVGDLVRAHPRIELLESDASLAFDQVASLIEPGEEVLVVEDSSHTFEHTLAVLRSYSSLVRPGGYMVVEDTICHHGLDVGPDPGPWEAVEHFLSENDAFERDRDRESFVITWNEKGFLRRLDK